MNTVVQIAIGVIASVFKYEFLMGARRIASAVQAQVKSSSTVTQLIGKRVILAGSPLISRPPSAN